MPPPNLKRRRSSWGDVDPDDEVTTGGAKGCRKPKRPDPGVGADLHYRTLYASEPDFIELGRQYPEFDQLSA
jgi:hypothetical protein